jgi:hypothetical protein
VKVHPCLQGRGAGIKGGGTGKRLRVDAREEESMLSCDVISSVTGVHGHAREEAHAV